MIEPSIRVRFLITAMLLAGAAILLHAANRPTQIPVRKPLAELPLSLGEWQGVDVPLTERLVTAAGVDDYLNRAYSDAAGRSVEIYVGYYGSQRSGDLIHSPKNCLPAAGWEWVRKGRLELRFSNQTSIVVNDFRIAKGTAQDLVLYWYQGRGRVIAGEYAAKLWMVFDAATRHRNDGSLVRIAVPIQRDEEAARQAAIQFISHFYPRLNEFLPE